MMDKGQVTIETEIAKIKKALLEVGHMHPGSLSQQKRSRGDSSRGGSPRGGSSRGGIYHQLSYSHAGKGHTKYVRSEDVPEVTQEIENYRQPPMPRLIPQVRKMLKSDAYGWEM
jgi:hypothetical protein